MLAQLLAPEVREAIAARDLCALRRVVSDWEPPEIADLIEYLAADEQVILFRALIRNSAAAVFEYLPIPSQQRLLESLGRQEVANVLNEMAPDDRTDLLEDLPGPALKQLLALLSPEERRIARELLRYPEDSIGRLMSPELIAVREDWTVAQVLDHIRQVGEDSETLNVIYVVDHAGRLLSDVRIRELLLAPVEERIDAAGKHNPIALDAHSDQETAVQLIMEYDRTALPVVDAEGFLLGIVTIDDVLDVAQEEATEDIQKIGGVRALGRPYLDTGLWSMMRKRVVWLVILFLGQMLTANALARFQKELASVMALVLFLPLIISSGGNSGSQAATLVVRAMALGELAARDWWRVLWREIVTGITLGLVVGVIGFLRVTTGAGLGENDQSLWLGLSLTVSMALVMVVLWGTLVGSMLPFMLDRIGLDPATSSTPFVATIVDVTGLVIYLTLAAHIL